MNPLDIFACNLFTAAAFAAQGTLKPGQQRLYWHPEVGQYYVRRMFSNYPDGLPYFTNGCYYATEAGAVAGFFAACEEHEPGYFSDDDGTMPEWMRRAIALSDPEAP